MPERILQRAGLSWTHKMADTRTRYLITKDQWTKIIDGGTSATVWRELHGPSYYNMLYDNASDTPTGFPATAQKMFEAGDTAEFEYPSAAYLWVTCKEENGAVIVTE